MKLLGLVVLLALAWLAGALVGFASGVEDKKRRQAKWGDLTARFAHPAGTNHLIRED